MNELTRVFEGRQLRIINQDGEPWFIAKDICDILGLEQVSRALDRLSEDERGLVKVTHPQSSTAMLDMAIVSESGLYALIIRSDKPEAKRFRKWVTSEVLPSIRKTGGYLSPSVDFTDPDNIQRLLDSWKEDRKKLTMAEGRIDRLVHNNRTYSTTEIAKELGMRSAQELNAALSEKGIIYKDKRGVWMLYAEYASKGFQNIKQREKENVTIYYAEWTGLGRDWLVGMFHKGEQ